MTWYEEEKAELARPGNWLSKLPPVPATLTIAPYEDMTLKPLKVERKMEVIPKGYEQDSKVSMRWMGYHPNAYYGIRARKEAAVEGAGNQAMYTREGLLITGGLSAGTADKISPNVDFWGHQRVDVKPFKLAKELDEYYGVTKYRYLYIEVRPPNAPKDAPPNTVD